MLVGDGRMFLTALIVPEFEVLKEFAKQNGIAASDDFSLAKHEDVREMYRKEIDRIQKDLPTYEKVRRFELLSQALTVEGGEITPTMKVKRKVVEEKFGALIEKMYEDVT